MVCNRFFVFLFKKVNDLLNENNGGVVHNCIYQTRNSIIALLYENLFNAGVNVYINAQGNPFMVSVIHLGMFYVLLNTVNVTLHNGCIDIPSIMYYIAHDAVLHGTLL